MQREIRLTDDEWKCIMTAMDKCPAAPGMSREEIIRIQNKILTQLRCHEALQTMAPACISPVGEKGHGTQA